jgi:NAD(P)-dependent dehydrogenase (short-subunit alcohol dehydrogenase family)
MVANAGHSTGAPLTDLTLEQWNYVIGVDLTGPFLCFRAAARDMIGRSAPGALIAVLIAVASVAAMHTEPATANCAAATARLLGLVRTAATELAPHGICATP